MNKLLLYILLPSTLILVIISFMMLNLGEKAAENKNNSDRTVSQKSESESTMLSNTGAIEGSLSFPSEGIPENMMVCAETLEGDIKECTNSHIKDAKYEYGEGYRLNVPPGTYFVYALVPESEIDTKAYYNEFVVCGLSASCDSHELITVEVESGKTTSNIDPGDWYNTFQTQ